VGDSKPVITITPVDSAYMRVQSDRRTEQEIFESFKFFAKNYQHTPLYKKGKWNPETREFERLWDGKIKLYNRENKTMYAGLLDKVKDWANKKGYQVVVDPLLGKIRNNYTVDEVEDYINNCLQPHSNGVRLTAEKHQITATHMMLNNYRTTILSPTASGKSLMIYAAIRKLLTELPEEEKILLIVPKVGLVNQMYADFADYSSNDKEWNAKDHCHDIMAGQEKESDKRVFISTWQSIYTLNKDWFSKFGAVIGDEVHHFKAKSLERIMTNLTDCPIRMGLTGTLDGVDVNELTVIGLFGPSFVAATTKELIDKNILSPLVINALEISYPDSDRKIVKPLCYDEELKFLTSHAERSDFIRDLALSLDGNTLILSVYLDHIDDMIRRISEKDNTRKVFKVTGKVNPKQRELFRGMVENESKAIIIATYGTFSTGINIRRLHNLIFSTPCKGKVRVLQSIGRELRKSKHKDVANCYDIVDNLTWRNRDNYCVRHFVERHAMYMKEDFEVKKYKFDI
jgi:superfamily II DNA or RNA helicase